MESQSFALWMSGLQNDLDLQTQDIAGAEATSPRTVERWLAGITFPQRDARTRLDQLYSLVTHIYLMFEDRELARHWLHAESSYLGMMKPSDVLRAGRIDAVEGALSAMDHGFLA